MGCISSKKYLNTLADGCILGGYTFFPLFLTLLVEFFFLFSCGLKMGCLREDGGGGGKIK